TLADLVSGAIDVVAPTVGRDPASIGMRTIDTRPGEKAYEELMTAEESTRARDIGDMYVVLPAIEAHPEVIAAYADAPRPPVAAYTSHGAEPMTRDGVREILAEAFAGELD